MLSRLAEDPAMEPVLAEARRRWLKIQDMKNLQAE
jgi:hypothetical protein